MGSAQIRLIALQIAGAIGGTPGSPTPPGAALLSTMWTRVSGVMSVRATKRPIVRSLMLQFAWSYLDWALRAFTMNLVSEPGAVASKLPELARACG